MTRAGIIKAQLLMEPSIIECLNREGVKPDFAQGENLYPAVSDLKEVARHDPTKN